jgi:hypothetical protein
MNIVIIINTIKDKYANDASAAQKLFITKGDKIWMNFNYIVNGNRYPE